MHPDSNLGNKKQTGQKKEEKDTEPTFQSLIQHKEPPFPLPPCRTHIKRQRRCRRLGSEKLKLAGTITSQCLTAQGTSPPWAVKTRIPHKFRNPSVNKALLTTFHTVKK